MGRHPRIRDGHGAARSRFEGPPKDETGGESGGKSTDAGLARVDAVSTPLERGRLQLIGSRDRARRDAPDPRAFAERRPSDRRRPALPRWAARAIRSRSAVPARAVDGVPSPRRWAQNQRRLAAAGRLNTRDGGTRNAGGIFGGRVRSPPP